MVSNTVRKVNISRKLVPLVLGVSFFTLPAVGHATNNCPWLNEATAGGLLGGDAVGITTDAAAGQPTVCTFTQQETGVTRTLRITVEIAPEPHQRMSAIAEVCGADVTPIKAIGNEALVCTADDRKGGVGERVVGRVRDQVFTITIASTLKVDPILNRDALKAKIYTAAEQVAGNLF
ncbi:MAG: hypothetical protein ABSF28_25825 [Terracidiphilus sp.]|jgi:hypothetical protein